MATIHVATLTALFCIAMQDDGHSKPRLADGKPTATKPQTPPEGAKTRPKTDDSPKMDDLWTMNLDAMKTPTDRFVGRVGGRPFQPDKVQLTNDILKFRSGKDFLADCEIIVFLFKSPKELVGKVIQVGPKREIGSIAPHIHVHDRRPKKTGTGSNISNVYVGDYAMKLEFHRGKNGNLQGKIHLCLPDKDKSLLAGTFELTEADSASVSPMNDGAITGDIKVQLPAKRTFASVAVHGLDAKGGPIVGSYIGMDLTPGESAEASSSEITLAKTKKGTMYKLQPAVPGTYLVIFSLDRIPVAWEWVDHRKGGTTAQDLETNTKNFGSLEVALSGPPVGEVRLLPLDAKGSLPESVGDGSKVAASFGPSMKALIATVPTGKNSVNFPKLAAGHYRVFGKNLRADVQVMPGKTNKVVLK